MPDLIHCDAHGEQEETFVCRHLAETLQTREPVGFYFSSEPKGDAWCSECEEMRLAEGGTNGDWNEKSEEFADITLICGSCYDRIREING